jgi:hypothetical protein
MTTGDKSKYHFKNNKELRIALKEKRRMWI